MRKNENVSFLSGDNKIAWTPTKEQIESANITSFMKKHHIPSYETLLYKSVHEPDWFYPAILEELAIPWFQNYEKVVDLSSGVELPLWFPGGLTNLYHYGLEKHVKNGNGKRTALIWEGEDGSTRTVTFEELMEETDRLANGLKNLGVKKGDRVGVFLPQVPEIQPVLFACAKLGAVVIPCFSGFGSDAVAVRLNDGEAKWLITADGFFRKGKVVELEKVAEDAAKLVPTLEKLIIVNRITKSFGEQPKSLKKNAIYYHEILLEDGHKKIKTEAMKSDEPLLIIYTSGTTGKPKGTQHTHYSFPLKNAIDMYFCFDVKANDRMFWLTDIGWMMGPWHIFGTAINGAAAVLYEGSPDYPSEKRLWELVEKHQVSIMGVAPTVIRSMMNYDDNPAVEYNLETLRILGSTGEAWNPKPWKWYFEKVGAKRCPIINYSGGTEISGGILSCVPIKPLKPCSFHGPAPGMAATVVDQNGKDVHNKVGDLVITKPFVGMTYSYWNDHQRYLHTYWHRWQGIWHHGDFAAIDSDGYWFILGRSDDTMNIAGKRLGPADIESLLVNHPLVKESAVISIPDEVKGEVPLLFVVPHTYIDGADILKLMHELKQTIADKLGKAFLPKHMIVVTNLPKTQSGKVARRIIRSAFLHQGLGDISTLQNPECIDEIKRAGEKK
ncbi:AMP-binding protein [Caldibacillus lycopersici]|uniref:acetate--CoA ligase n=1 Tax=Perspicuibacillus lycopersici TaxID=1325689 RepID=A0AAE3LLG2_9BACI|nr:AMP-binding protein [Perspicuibacillus lycopersici]MCU9612310.1 AMP-binding protein [Perspicuibacillus lycopersici]